MNSQDAVIPSVLRPKLLFATIVLALAADAAAPCEADTIALSRNNLGLSIPDGAYDGSLASMAAATLTVADSRKIVDVNAFLGISHTWLGDLVIKLQSPSGTLITLMQAADDSSNLDQRYPVTFDDDGGNPPASAMGVTIQDFEIVCRYDDMCIFTPDQPLSSFDGQTANGTWTLYFGDEAALDPGSVAAVTLILELTPDVPPGDFNADGTVDAADYVVWRKNEGMQPEYDTWRTHFGVSFGTGAGASAAANSAVPEPAAPLLVIAALFAGLTSQRATQRQEEQSRSCDRRCRVWLGHQSKLAQYCVHAYKARR